MILLDELLRRNDPDGWKESKMLREAQKVKRPRERDPRVEQFVERFRKGIVKDG